MLFAENKGQGAKFMSGNDIFGGIIETASKALDLRSRRHRMIVSNIANADTPGYKAFDLHVEEQLQKGENEHKNVLYRTNPKHLQSSTSSKLSSTAGQVLVDEQVTLRGDGNTVDMEREMSNLASNRLMYKATTQILNKKLQLLKSVIQGGKR